MKFVMQILLLFGFETRVAGQSPGPFFELSTYSREHTDTWSFSANPSALPGIRQPAIAMVALRPFLLPELNRFCIAASFPVAPGAFGLHIQNIGGSDFGEINTGLAYGRRLGSKVDAGIQFNYYGIHAAGYGQSSAIGFSAGTILQLSTKLRGGISASNAVGGRFGKHKEEKLPSVYSFGFGYEVSEKCFVGLEIIKQENVTVNVNTGIHYALHKNCFIRTGISTATGSFWAGTCFTMKSYRLDLACSYHPQLGFTPGLGLMFSFQKRSP